MKKGNIVEGLPSADQHYSITGAGTRWLIYEANEKRLFIGDMNLKLLQEYTKTRKRIDSPVAAHLEAKRVLDLGGSFYVVEKEHFKVTGEYSGTNNESFLFSLNKDNDL